MGVDAQITVYKLNLVPPHIKAKYHCNEWVRKKKRKNLFQKVRKLDQTGKCNWSFTFVGILYV